MKKIIDAVSNTKQTRLKSNVKTALVLSGGGSRGAYQCGVWQAMNELGITVDMVVGVSVGALNGAMVVQGDQFLSAGLWRKLATDKVFDVKPDAQLSEFAIEFFKNGGAGSSGLQSLIQNFLDEDYVRKSEIDYGLLTVEFPSMKPHYLWKKDIPPGKLGDYIAASASAFPAVQTYSIDGKNYIDGGFENNMPIHMAVENGASNIIAVYLKAAGRFDAAKELSVSNNITLICPEWDLGSFLVFDPENSAHILRLGYLDAMKAFGVYEGTYYAFVKKEFKVRLLDGIDKLAYFFEFDPLILYNKKNFTSRLLDVIIESSKEHQALKETDLSANTVKTLLRQLNKKNTVILIAKSLKEKGEGSIFSKSYVRKLMSAEIKAAQALISFDIL